MTREYNLDQIRNIGIIAHIDAGKTTTTERILFYTGKKHKIGEVHEGEAEMDWMKEEKEHGVTITAAATTCFWTPRDYKTCQINIIDTPGHIDFTAEVQRSLRVLDSGVLIFDGVSGVESQSETVYHQAEKFTVPLVAYVNKMDRLGADFFETVRQIRERLHQNAYPIELPIGKESNFKGVIDLFTRKAKIYKDDLGKEIEEQDVPLLYKEEVEKYRHELIEAIVEHSDDLMRQYLAGEELRVEDLKEVLRQAVIKAKIIPILVGSSLKNKGVQSLLDAICFYLPSPLDKGAAEGFIPGSEEKLLREPLDNESFSGLIFKIATDPFVGRLSYLRIYSGKIEAGSYVLNTTTGLKERVSRILRMYANHREEMQEAATGEIVAVIGLKNTTTGDTLCDEKSPIVLERITFPEPVVSMAVEPKSKIEQEKLGLALSRLISEDPTFKTKVDEETGQIIISGMGEFQLNIIIERLFNEFKLEVNKGAPQVAYKETITLSVKSEGKYIHQSGGRGQYGHCFLQLEPVERGQGFEFVDKIKSGAIPQEFIPAIKKGTIEAMTEGPLAGYPMVDMKVTVFDGSYHDVDSSEAAFKIAAARAIRDGALKAKPALLEPIMKVEVVMPEKFLGEVIGDLNSRRAQILGTRDRGRMKVIDSLVPLGSMFNYITYLRSMTEGRGGFTMEFLKYEKVPENITNQIVGLKSAVVEK
ncbi:elongation factor G [Candidatus Kuenenbacteria bacterium]|nr:elongation factor G [Candidatus Kuenenbacteria bacterium]